MLSFSDIQALHEGDQYSVFSEIVSVSEINIMHNYHSSEVPL